MIDYYLKEGMTIDLRIRQLGDPVLRLRAAPVKKIDQRLKELMNRMLEGMKEAQGVGLAAPQVGISQRFFVVQLEDETYRLVNPEIIETGGRELAEESCLSVPERSGLVPRWEWVRLKALNAEGEEVVIEAEGLLARVFQHEHDHLEGRLFIDLVGSDDPLPKIEGD